MQISGGSSPAVLKSAGVLTLDPPVGDASEVIYVSISEQDFRPDKVVPHQ